jgi:hypothetical protein
MTFKYKVYFKIFGDRMLEAYLLDSYLSAFDDGLPRTELPVATGQVGWQSARVEKKLVEDNFLEVFGNGYKITSKGMLHLHKGGYSTEVKNALLLPLTFWLSITATILSIISVIRGFAK